MMLEELSEDLNSIKKIQSKTKDTLIEIKNNLQGNNSRVDEACLLYTSDAADECVNV